ncbi:tyrosine-type recombinase/integrase [Roseibium sp.]|uniref:tyrosine-type recombinase/integrase n=1 Tax=Roseibium sp. TaxID=1936156 RepID=UPI00391CBF96
MPENKLSDRQVKAAGPGIHGDGNGLYLRVSHTGRRSWIFIWTRNKVRNEIGLGPFDGKTSHVGLADARKKAQECREILGRGGDPKTEFSERRDRVKLVTFGQCADDYLAAQEPGWKSKPHAAQWRLHLTEYAEPIRSKPVSAVTVDDMVRLLQPIWLEKAESARRIRSRIEAVLDYAAARKLRSGDNPARLKGNLDHLLPSQKTVAKKHHAAMRYQDVPAFITELQGTLGYAARALEFTILTAARTGEVIGAKWTEFDLEARTWTVPAERMKAGKAHTVPLSDAAMTALQWCHDHQLNDYVFAGAKQDRPLSNMSMTKVLKTHGRGDVTVHGFRSAFRDWAGNETSFPREVAEECLAHVVGNAVERAYRRQAALEKRLKLLSAWGQYLVPKTGNVVPINITA